MSTEKVTGSKSTYDKFLDLLSDINTAVIGAALVFLTVIFGWLVFGRYVLNATPTWVEQVALLLVVYIGFLGIGRHSQENAPGRLGVSRDKPKADSAYLRICDTCPDDRIWPGNDHLWLQVDRIQMDDGYPPHQRA